MVLRRYSKNHWNCLASVFRELIRTIRNQLSTQPVKGWPIFNLPNLTWYHLQGTLNCHLQEEMFECFINWAKIGFSRIIRLWTPENQVQGLAYIISRVHMILISNDKIIKWKLVFSLKTVYLIKKAKANGESFSRF